MVLALKASEVKQSVIDGLRDSIMPNMQLVLELNRDELAQKCETLEGLMLRLRHNAPANKSLLLQLIRDNVEQNSFGYEAALAQGGIDNVIRMLADHLVSSRNQLDIAAFRAQKEPAMLAEDISNLIKTVERLTSVEFVDIRAPYHLYFSYPESERFRHTLVKYNSVLKKCETINSQLFNFMNCQTVQVGTEVYSFSWDRQLSVTKFSNLLDQNSIKRAQMTPGTKHREKFALANLDDKIVYLSGGWSQAHLQSDGMASKTVLKYNLDNDDWQQGPSLSVARYVHSSVIIGDKRCCVFGGIGSANEYLNSIEILEVRSSNVQTEWQLVQLDSISARILPVLCPLSSSELLIMGGQYRNSDGRCKVLSSAHIVDIVRKQTSIVREKARLCFDSWGPSQQQENGVALSLVSDGKAVLRMVSYTQQTGEVSMIAELGRWN